jgi:hypothetical protein
MSASAPDEPGRSGSRSGVRIYEVAWGPDDRRRPGLPWIGVFLIVFGALLILERTVPEYRNLGNIAVLAAGLASLVVWLLGRSTIALYAGALLTALALPGAIEGLGYDLGPGWGTLFLGLGFAGIALVRAARGGGWGWQAMWGAVLALLGASQIAVGDLAGLVVPVALVVLGIALLTRPRLG